MSNPPEAQRSPTTSPQPAPHSELDALRAILLDEERQRIHQLEQKNEALQTVTEVQSEAIAAQIDTLLREIEALQQANAQQKEYINDLDAELKKLQQQFQTDSQALIPRLIEQMGHIISHTIRTKRDELAEALGPIMSDAIRVQVRDSRQEMIEALYPIILETVMRAVTEFLREVQRNIDARLKTTFRFGGFIKRFGARLRGVSDSELTLRDSFAFSLEEIFLIQHESGLLVAHHGRKDEENDDSDLIGGMLTAIRDFARDSFGEGMPDQELREIEFGDERIIIQSGQYIYAAAVIKGIEPTGFHARLQELVSELHIQHKPALRDFVGDPAALPDLAPILGSFNPQAPADQAMPRNQRLLLVGGAGLLLLLTAFACFYLQFTIALWPLAFGPEPTTVPVPSPSAVPTTTVVSVVVPSPTLAPTATATWTPQPTFTATAVPPTETTQPTSTHTPTPTNTPLPSPTIASAPVTIRPVWVRAVPDLNTPTIAAIPANTAVTILDSIDQWVEIEWQDATGRQQGWLGVGWLAVDGMPLTPVPPSEEP
jgi:hypothetical protein